MSAGIVIVGAGIVGACCAHALLKDGHQVTIVDPGMPGGEQAASFGNGAWISPASVVPMSMPGMWRRVPRYLLDPRGPLSIRWQDLIHLAPWLIRFVMAGSTVEKVEATARALSRLIGDASSRHAVLAREVGCEEMVRASGLIYAYRSRDEFETEKLAWQLREGNGVHWTELDSAALRQFEPHLSDRYTFAVRVADGAFCFDPGAYVAAIVNHAQELGATVVRASAIGFVLEREMLQAVATNQGDLACDTAVLCAGIHSKRLAQLVGEQIPMASERGYHVVISDPEAGPSVPVMPADGKMANTMTRSGLRAAGQVELARVDAPPNWQRADILLDHLLSTYPGLPKHLPSDRLARWMGHRPSTPDGLPVIGRSKRCQNLLLATGHGHVGLCAAPTTAAIVADLVAGRSPTVPIAPYRPDRF